MARFAAFLDACVRVPITLADTLLRLAEAGLYRPLWSERILNEMVDAVVAVHPALPSGAVRRRASVMQSSFPDATVTDWQDLQTGFTLSDPGRSTRCGGGPARPADMIMASNLRDFPADLLEPMGLEVQDPDTFLLNELDLELDVTIATLHRQTAATRRRPSPPGRCWITSRRVASRDSPLRRLHSWGGTRSRGGSGMWSTLAQPPRGSAA